MADVAVVELAELVVLVGLEGLSELFEAHETGPMLFSIKAHVLVAASTTAGRVTSAREKYKNHAENSYSVIFLIRS